MDGDKVRSQLTGSAPSGRGAGRTGTRRLTAVANKSTGTFHQSEMPSRLARSCCPARAFRHLHRNTSASTPAPSRLSLGAPLRLRESSAAWPSAYPCKGKIERCCRAFDADVWVPRPRWEAWEAQLAGSASAARCSGNSSFLVVPPQLDSGGGDVGVLRGAPVARPSTREDQDRGFRKQDPHGSTNLLQI